MITLNIQQGTSAWYAHRASHWNASDSPAMLGVSTYKSRNQLIRERATGVEPELDSATLRRFADGHRFEALARPIAEQIIGEELYPCVGVEGRYSASFDGLTLLGDTAFEHKTLNDDLRAVMVDGCTGADLPEHYRVQMEQQCMVSDAERVLFMASLWDGDELAEERHCWYTPNPELRARIVAGWTQFEADVAAYVPEQAAAPAPAVRAPESLPTIAVQVSGQITIRDNFETFEVAARQFLDQQLVREPQTDEDFVTLDQQIKTLREAEAALDAAEAQILAQVETIDAAKRRKDMLVKLLRDNRLMAEKLLASEKERRRAEIVAVGREAVIDHYRAINATLGEHAIGVPAPLSADLGAAIKGLRTLSSLRNAVDTAVAGMKIAASQQVERIRACIAVLADAGAEHVALFPDRVALCAAKAPDDLRNLVAARIADHEKREQARLEAERERIRAEEAAKARAEAELEATAMAQRQYEEDMDRHLAAEHEADARKTSATAARISTALSAVPVAAGTRIKLGDINARLAPLSISADGLAQLGFAAVGTSGAAKLYAESDWPRICDAVIALVSRAATTRRAA